MNPTLTSRQKKELEREDQTVMAILVITTFLGVLIGTFLSWLVSNWGKNGFKEG